MIVWSNELLCLDAAIFNSVSCLKAKKIYKKLKEKLCEVNQHLVN